MWKGSPSSSSVVDPVTGPSSSPASSNDHNSGWNSIGPNLQWNTNKANVTSRHYKLRSPNPYPWKEMHHFSLRFTEHFNKIRISKLLRKWVSSYYLIWIWFRGWNWLIISKKNNGKKIDSTIDTFLDRKCLIRSELKVVPKDWHVANEQDQQLGMCRERECWRGDEKFAQRSVWGSNRFS